MIDKNLIKIDVEVRSPEEAIKEGGELLKNNGYINEAYIENMIGSYKEFGSYIVIAPSIAIPHAEPKKNVVANGISFIRLKNPIEFNHPINDPVKLVFCMASVDKESHLSTLRQLASFLNNKSNINRILLAKSIDEIVEIMEVNG